MHARVNSSALSASAKKLYSDERNWWRETKVMKEVLWGWEKKEWQGTGEKSTYKFLQSYKACFPDENLGGGKYDEKYTGKVMGDPGIQMSKMK